MSRSNPDAVKTSRGRDPDDFFPGSQGSHERPNASGQEHEPSGEERAQASRENTQALTALATSDFHSLAALEIRRALCPGRVRSPVTPLVVLLLIPDRAKWAAPGPPPAKDGCNFPVPPMCAECRGHGNL